MTEPDDFSNVRYVTEHLFGRVPVIGLRRADGGGLSGTTVWRVTTPQGEFALRAWASEPAVRERVARQLRWQRELAELQFIARTFGEVVESHGRLWTLETWLPGEPGGAADSSDDSIAQVFHALAEIHRRWSNLQPLTFGPSPAAAKRRQILTRHPALRDLALPPQLAALQTLVAPHLPRARELAHQLAESQFKLQPCLIDIRGDNLLFNGEQLTGIVDFGAAAIDTPLVDLSRALGEVVGPDPARRATALAAYEGLVPLQSGDWETIRALEITGLVAAAINWLEWLAKPQAADNFSARLAKLNQRLTDLDPPSSYSAAY